MSHSDHQEAVPEPSPLTIIGVLVAIVMTLHLLINVAARPWGWPEGNTGSHAEAPPEGGH